MQLVKTYGWVILTKIPERGSAEEGRTSALMSPHITWTRSVGSQVYDTKTSGTLMAT